MITIANVIYKGYSLPKKSEKYLVSCELKGAPYYISAYDVHKELYGKLDSRPYQVGGSVHLYLCSFIKVPLCLKIFLTCRIKYPFVSKGLILLA